MELAVLCFRCCDLCGRRDGCNSCCACDSCCTCDSCAWCDSCRACNSYRGCDSCCDWCGDWYTRCCPAAEVANRCRAGHCPECCVRCSDCNCCRTCDTFCNHTHGSSNGSSGSNGGSRNQQWARFHRRDRWRGDVGELEDCRVLGCGPDVFGLGDCVWTLALWVGCPCVPIASLLAHSNQPNAVVPRSRAHCGHVVCACLACPCAFCVVRDQLWRRLGNVSTGCGAVQHSCAFLVCLPCAMCQMCRATYRWEWDPCDPVPKEYLDRASVACSNATTSPKWTRNEPMACSPPVSAPPPLSRAT